MIVNYVTAKKHGFGHTKKFHAGHLLRTLGDSIWALLVPVIILGGIYGGIFTPCLLYTSRSWEPICVTLISIKRLRPPMHAWDPAVQPSVSARNWRNISPDPGYGSMEPDITQIMTMKARWERSASSREAWQLYCGHTPGL